jgi:outer membrane protein OmpA-like peptidoglycan-associated protein
VVAKPISTAYQVEARNLRLVRSGDQELALQFDFFNGTQNPLSPWSLGIENREELVALVDVPRGTGYGILGGSGANGSISANVEEDVAPGASATLTVMFAAPPKETTEMMVVIYPLRPVRVPVQPQGAAALADDPVLHAAHATSPSLVGPLTCKVAGGDGGSGEAPSEIRLSSDVLFTFGSASLSPAARTAIQSVGEQIGATSGTITVEGHTDGVGSDAANQALSTQRAAAVRDALRADLGDGFAYRATGFGETRPVAPNTKPDGSDNPDGRAQNRRVELRVETQGKAQKPLVLRTGNTDLADAGLQMKVDSVQRIAGYVLAQVVVTNPTSEAQKLDFDNHFTPEEITVGQITLADGTAQRRSEPCGFAPPIYFDYIGNLGQDFWTEHRGSVPPGAEVVLWSLFAAPKATSVDVEVGGFGETQKAEITTAN